MISQFKGNPIVYSPFRYVGSKLHCSYYMFILKDITNRQYRSFNLWANNIHVQMDYIGNAILDAQKHDSLSRRNRGRMIGTITMSRNSGVFFFKTMGTISFSTISFDWGMGPKLEEIKKAVENIYNGKL
ncbi:hypothetical protein CJF31_00006403 [Rutstroemia sp. NJR-2017a BVV2]|nr:hypothetical protein CJF31_00006403 [Rutstroemia sp. NJR-2017a BVV2]